MSIANVIAEDFKMSEIKNTTSALEGITTQRSTESKVGSVPTRQQRPDRNNQN